MVCRAVAQALLGNHAETRWLRWRENFPRPLFLLITASNASDRPAA